MNDLSESSRFSQPFVSALIPCRNEEHFIDGCLKSVVENGYPLDRLEVLVIDGVSTDATLSIVTGWSARHDCIRLMANPRGITPCALNIGVAAASGDVIIRLDAHATYEPGYISECVKALNLDTVGSSGGVWNVKPRTASLVAGAIAACMSHPFGGAARYRRVSQGEPEIANMVPFFCSRRETLGVVGRFNEALVRHQDYEYSERMRRAGYRFVLVPTAVCNYYTRSDLRSFALHSFRDGFWVTFSTAFTEVLPISMRHAVPMLFAAMLIAGTITAAFSAAVRSLLLGLSSMYLIIMIASAIQVAAKKRDARMVLVMSAVFACRHMLFGIGEIVGLVRAYASQLIARIANSRHRANGVPTG